MRRVPISTRLVGLLGLVLTATSMAWVSTEARGDTVPICECRDVDLIWCPFATNTKYCPEKYIVKPNPDATPPVKGNVDTIQATCEAYTSHERSKGPFKCEAYDVSLCYIFGYCYYCAADLESFYICAADFKCKWDPEGYSGPLYPKEKLGACVRGDPIIDKDGIPVTTMDRGYYSDECFPEDP